MDHWSRRHQRPSTGSPGSFKDGVTYGLLNPLQTLLAESPWWLDGAGILAFACVIGGWRAVVPTLIGWPASTPGLWNDTMITLNMTLVATLLVMLLAVRPRGLDGAQPSSRLGIRPMLDAGQTIPPFVYLIPVLALFGPSRFTAIVAARHLRGAGRHQARRRRHPRRVADDRRGRPVHREHPVAGDHQGAAADGQASLVLATNQGLLYVLAMVVIGGLVGAGASATTSSPASRQDEPARASRPASRSCCSAS